MKKMMIMAACFCFSLTALATESIATRQNAEMNYTADWQECGTVQIVKKQGRIKISNSARVRRDGSTVQAYYGGEWRNCSSSNLDGYTYMFYDGRNGYWHFNL